jgi:hypothetical protein
MYFLSFIMCLCSSLPSALPLLLWNRIIHFSSLQLKSTRDILALLAFKRTLPFFSSVQPPYIFYASVMCYFYKTFLNFSKENCILSSLCLLFPLFLYLLLLYFMCFSPIVFLK